MEKEIEHMENMQHHEKTKLLNYRHRSGGRILGYWHKPHLQQDDKKNKKEAHTYTNTRRIQNTQ